MTDDLNLPGKWRLKAHGQTLVLHKRKLERSAHVIMKGLLWALYLPEYPDIQVEVKVGLRYKPDLVARSVQGDFLFWGEAGRVGLGKVEKLLRRYRDTHFVFAKWDCRLEPWQAILQQAASQVEREAPVELLGFPPDSRERFVSDNGEVRVELDQLEFYRF